VVHVDPRRAGDLHTRVVRAGTVRVAESHDRLRVTDADAAECPGDRVPDPRECRIASIHAVTRLTSSLGYEPSGTAGTTIDPG
jgi:hypothetical protein